MFNFRKPVFTSAHDAWEILDSLTPAQLCAALPTAIDQSKGFKLSYLGTEDIDSPICFALPTTNKNEYVYFIVEDFEFFQDIDHESLFDSLTNDLSMPSYESIPALTDSAIRI